MRSNLGSSLIGTPLTAQELMEGLGLSTILFESGRACPSLQRSCNAQPLMKPAKKNNFIRFTFFGLVAPLSLVAVVITAVIIIFLFIIILTTFRVLTI